MFSPAAVSYTHLLRSLHPQLTLDRSYAGSRADIVHRRSCKVRSQNGALKLRILLDKNLSLIHILPCKPT